MASLISRFFIGTTRGDMPQDALPDHVPAHAESTRKSHNRHSMNVKTRKSITSLFGFAAKDTPSEDGRDALVHTIATCQEAQHYPIYDPTNPEHEPRAIATEKPRNSESPKRGYSRSPTKAPRWKRSPSPRKPTGSARGKSRLQGFADTLRAKANIFYQLQQHSSEEELMPHEPSVPPTPGSARSISSKKSVRFRSGHSVIGNVQVHSSPITIPIKSPPSLAMVNISSTPVFDATSEEEKNLRQTARPPETLPPPMLTGPSPENANQPQLSLEVEDSFSIAQALPTPMPGTNLPLDDPFDDAAAALCSEHPTSRILTGQAVSDQKYCSDGDKNANMNKMETVRIYRTRMTTTQINLESSPQSTHFPQPNSSATVLDDGDESARDSFPVGQRTLRRTKALPLTLDEPSSISRLPSETQYDADTEPSDGSDAQKEQVKSVAVRLQHQQVSHETEVSEDGEFGADLVRCKTPDQPRFALQGAVPRLTLKKPSSDETEGFASSLSTGSDAVMQYADYPENGLAGVETPSTYDLLETTRQRERLASINLRPTLRPGDSGLEGIESGDAARPREPTKATHQLPLLADDKEKHEQFETTTSLADSNDPSARICPVSSTNTVSPLHLSATVSSTSPLRSPWHVRIYQDTDEEVETEPLDHHSSFAHEVAAELTQPQSRGWPQSAPTASPSPADTPLQLSVNPARTRMPSLYDATGISPANMWSPFNEPRFVYAAYFMLEGSPQKFAKRLQSEGIGRDFWNEMGLPDATAPPKGRDPYTESESLELLAAVTDKARASSSSHDKGLRQACPPDYSDGQIIDLQALSTFNGPVSPLSLRSYSQGRHASRIQDGLPQSGSTSPLSIFSSRRSSLGRPTPFVESRQPSSHGLALHRRPNPDTYQFSGLEITPLPDEPKRELLHDLALERQAFTAHQPNFSVQSGAKAEAMDESAENEHYPISGSSQKRFMLSQPTHPNTHCQPTAPPSLVMPSRKQSSDESQETNETMSSAEPSSTTSSSALSDLHSPESEGTFPVERQLQPMASEMATFAHDHFSAGSAEEVDSHQAAMLDQRHYLADTPKVLKTKNVNRDDVYCLDRWNKGGTAEAEKSSPTT